MDLAPVPLVAVRHGRAVVEPYAPGNSDPAKIRCAMLQTCLLVLVPLLAGAPLARAQALDEIVARHIQARGGYERLKALQTVRMARTVVTQFNELEVVILKKRPRLLRVEQRAPGQPVTLRGVTPDTAWDLAGGRLSTRSPQAAAEARAIDADFDGLLVDWQSKGHTIELAGREALPGGEAFKLQLRTKDGIARTIYIDAATYLERRHVGTLTLPQDRKATVEIDILGHKEAGGIKFPADIQEERTGAGPVQTIVIYTTAIEINVPIDDALFAPPPPPGPGGATPADLTARRFGRPAPAPRLRRSPSHR